MSIKINKQLNRPDGGKVSTGSIVDFNQKTKATGEDTGIVFFLISHYISAAAITDGKETIPVITEFEYTLSKVCDSEEWEQLLMGENQTSVLLHDWLKEIIDNKIGLGNTEII